MNWELIAIASVSAATTAYIGFRAGSASSRRSDEVRGGTARVILAVFRNHAARCEQCARAPSGRDMCDVGGACVEAAWEVANGGGA